MLSRPLAAPQRRQSSLGVAFVRADLSDPRGIDGRRRPSCATGDRPLAGVLRAHRSPTDGPACRRRRLRARHRGGGAGVPDLHERRRRGPDACRRHRGSAHLGGAGPVQGGDAHGAVGQHRTGRARPPAGAAERPSRRRSVLRSGARRRVRPDHRRRRPGVPGEPRARRRRIAGERTWLAPSSAPGPTLDTAAGLT